MEIEKIKSYSQLSEVLEDIDWQKFEDIVGKIFDFHDYDVKVSEVISFDDTKRQYDVVAEKEHIIFADCKKWDNKRRIKYGLKKAVEDQIERVEKRLFKKEKYPIIVTSNSNPIEYYMQVPIIPIYKLNEFLSKFQIHKQKTLRIN